MQGQRVLLTMAAGLLIASGNAVADHNSKNGEGWANMPNDVHNTRIETRESDDNDAFRDFVKNGNGADSVNRFATDTDQANSAAREQGSKAASGDRGKEPATNRRKTETQVATKDRSRVETRSRFEKQSMDMAQGRSRSMAGSRSGGRRH